MPADQDANPAAAELARLLRALRSRSVDELELMLDPRLRWTHASGMSESRDDLLQALKSHAVSYCRLEPEQLHSVAGAGFLIVGGIIDMEVERHGVVRTALSRFVGFWETAETARLLHWQSTRLA